MVDDFTSTIFAQPYNLSALRLMHVLEESDTCRSCNPYGDKVLDFSSPLSNQTKQALKGKEAKVSMHINKVNKVQHFWNGDGINSRLTIDYINMGRNSHYKCD